MNTGNAIAEPLDVIIVGAGISGIGMAAHLQKKCPSKRFAIVERRARLGGTWDLFRYPGVRSDSDMYTLGYGFEPWRDERSIAEGDKVLAYLEGVADRSGIREHIRFGRKALAADWDSSTALWTLTLENAEGGVETISGRFLFLGAGYYDYDEPHDPAIPGLDQFSGLTIYPQFWPEDLDYSGKNIVVIGSGTTAVTLVPALAKQASQVTMLQRTPSWYLSVPAKDQLAGLLNRLLPVALAYPLIRFRNVLVQDWFFKRSRKKPVKVADFLTKQLQQDLGGSFRSEDFAPPYGPWQQRLCFVPDGDFFEAIKAGKARIVTGRIASIDRSGVALENGSRIEADIIVTATGLRIATLGKIAVSLDGRPVDYSQAFYYRNCMFSNVPNLAALFGYLNTAWTLRVDIVADWLCRLFNQMDAWGADAVTPFLPEDHRLVEDNPIDSFTSGYLRRARHLIPKSAATAPWRLNMDYRLDRREMRNAPIDDGVLRFGRIGARQVPVPLHEPTIAVTP